MTEPTPIAATPSPRKRGVARAVRVLAALLVIGVGLMLTSARGLVWLLHGFVPTLAFTDLRGSLLEGVALRDVQLTAPDMTARARRIAMQWHVSLHGGLQLRAVQAEDLAIELSAGKSRAATGWPRLPFRLRIEDVQVDGFSLRQGSQLYVFSELVASIDLDDERVLVPQLLLRSGLHSVQGQLRYDGVLDARLDWQGALGARAGRASLSVRGALGALALELQVQAPWLATLRGQLDALAAPPRFKGEVSATAPGIGPLSGVLDGGLDKLQLQLRLPFATAAPALRDVELDFDLHRVSDTLGGALRWRLGDAAGLHGDGQVTLSTQGIDLALDSASPLTASVRARLLFADAGPQLGARLRWQDLPVAGLTPSTLTRGALQVRGAITDLFVRGDMVAADGGYGAMEAHWRGRLTPQSFALTQLDSALLGGHLRARGSADWQDTDCAHLTFDFAALDFSHVDAALASSLAGSGRSHWCRHDDGWQGGVAFEQLGGRWRGQAVRGRGEFELSSAQSALRKLHLELGANVFDADVELVPRFGGRFTLTAPDLGAVLASLAGRLQARGEVGGTLALPSLRAQLSGAALAFGSWRATALDGQFDIDAARAAASVLSLTLGGVSHDHTALGELALHGQGTAAAHSLALSLQGGALRAALAADGTWAAGHWSGALSALTLEHAQSGAWQLQGAAPLTLSAGDFTFGPACLTQRNAKLCASLPRWRAGGGSAALHITGLPVTLVQGWLPASLTPGGTLNAEADLAREAGLWHGQGQAHIVRGSLRYRVPGHADQRLPLRDAQATFHLDGERLRAELGASLGAWFDLRGTLDLGLAGEAPLRGQFDIEVPDITWLEEFVPDIAGSVGSAHGHVGLSGSRAAPLLDAELQQTAGSLLLPRFGTQVAQLSIKAAGAPNATLALRGEARVGEGVLHMTGDFDARGGAGPRAQLHLRGEPLALVRLPDIEADAAPDMEVTIAPKTFDLKGQVTWSRVQIHLPSLPERAVVTSPDEVVLDGAHERHAVAPRRRWFVDTLSAELDFTLGDEVELSAAGLDARLTGAVHWRKPRGDERGHGRGGFTIVDGHYKAYGQDLKIQRGVLIFDGPIDNPGLEVRAIRPDLDVIAGVRVTGNLRVPKFALFAEPSLPDAEVLAYLVTGHALANASSGEAGVIARAALSLGADRAALVTSQLSNLFALDEFGINPGKTARTSSIVAGKRLTPKLTVRSEFNPFERVWSFFVNYKLSPRWSVEAQTGAGQGADVIYSVERDRLQGGEPLKSDPAPLPPSP